VSARTFALPDLGEGLTEAEIVRWLVAEGDIVAVDQPVVEVETAKAMVEVPSPYAGQVATLHGPEGSTVDVGAPLITVAALGTASLSSDGLGIDGAGAAAVAYRAEERAGSGNVLVGYGTAERGSASGRRRRPRGAPVPVARDGAVPRVVSPLVRRLARDNGVDLNAVRGTGRGGVVSRADVVLAAAPLAAGPSTAPVSVTPSPATPGPSTDGDSGVRRVPLTGFRKTVAAALTRSRAEIPEATIWVDVDATALWELRESGRAAGGPGLLAFVARFVVAGLREYPVLNARFDGARNEIVEYAAINLGLAVQTDRGLVVPAVLDAHRMTTAELDVAIRETTEVTRAGRATAGQLSAGTFTVNNYGSFGVDGSAAIINHPQVAILGIGRILDRPWVVDGALAVRKICQLSFVFDHRVCDGGVAAGFVRGVADAIESPASAIARM
jgi:2-oxoisovalerate dehydrogenase E2 component (dihydrolipoyl transacylase)